MILVLLIDSLLDYREMKNFVFTSICLFFFRVTKEKKVFVSYSSTSLQIKLTVKTEIDRDLNRKPNWLCLAHRWNF